MILLSVTIPGPPVGKGRPRMSAKGGRARAFTPKKTRDWESGAAKILRAAWQDDPESRPVKVCVFAVAKRPEALEGKKHPDGRLWRPKRVDLDNVVKAVLDAMMLGGVLTDDAVVVELYAQSLYTAKGEEPHVQVSMFAVSELP